MSALIKQKLRKIDDNRWKVQLDDKTVKVKAQRRNPIFDNWAANPLDPLNKMLIMGPSIE